MQFLIYSLLYISNLLHYTLLLLKKPPFIKQIYQLNLRVNFLFKKTMYKFKFGSLIKNEHIFKYYILNIFILKSSKKVSLISGML